MFRFLHAADIHLDSPLRGLELPEEAPHDQIRAATRLALDNMVDLAIREKVSFVLIAGDVYDGDWRDFNTGLFFNQRMAQLRDANIRVFVVSGNHDAASQISINLPPSFVVVKILLTRLTRASGGRSSLILRTF